MKRVYIEGLEFVFMFLGYGLGILESGNKTGWIFIGLMLTMIIVHWVILVRNK